MKTVNIFTDGCCLGNPGRGGYGAILEYLGNQKELSAGYAFTTNNRMELLGCIVALETLKQPCSVILVTDSQYVVNGITKGWAEGWQSRGWRKADGKPAENSDLWKRLLDLTHTHGHEVAFQWVKGHAGHPENERCDVMAKTAASGATLLEDAEYLKKRSGQSDQVPGVIQGVLPGLNVS